VVWYTSSMIKWKLSYRTASQEPSEAPHVRYAASLSTAEAELEEIESKWRRRGDKVTSVELEKVTEEKT